MLINTLVPVNTIQYNTVHYINSLYNTLQYITVHYTNVLSIQYMTLVQSLKITMFQESINSLQSTNDLNN